MNCEAKALIDGKVVVITGISVCKNLPYIKPVIIANCLLVLNDP